MSGTTSVRWWIWFVALLGGITFSSAFCTYAKEPSVSNADNERDLRRLIDSLASRNHVPKIVLSTENDEVPIFTKNFDLSEEARVNRAFDRIAAHKTDAMWRQLVKSRNDDRYSITAWNDAFVDMTAENFTVGKLCRYIASQQLGEPYLRHMMTDEERIIGADGFAPQDIFWRHRAGWSGKPLYLIQIAVCEEAISQMATATKISPAHGDSPGGPLSAVAKARFAKEVQKEVEKLKSTKKATLPHGIGLPGIEMTPFEKKDVQRASDVLKKYGERK